MLACNNAELTNLAAPADPSSQIRGRGFALAVLLGLAIATGDIARAATHRSLDEVDISGVWRVDIVWERRCEWRGHVRLSQKDAQLTGSGDAAASNRFCPALQGQVEGDVSGSDVNFGFATGRLGTGEFSGELIADGRKMDGTWTAGRASGTWRAEQIN